MAEANAFGLPTANRSRRHGRGSSAIRRVAFRKLLDNARFANATIVSPGVDQALRIWRQDLDAYTDELTGRMLPYMTTVLTRSGNKIRSRVGLQKADDWFIRDPGRVQAIEAAVLDLCKDTLDTIGLDAAAKVSTIRAELIAGENRRRHRWMAGSLHVARQVLRRVGEVAVRTHRENRSQPGRELGHSSGGRKRSTTLVGFEWLMAPGACQACQLVGKTLDGQPRRVTKGNPFATDVGPKITNAGDPDENGLSLRSTGRSDSPRFTQIADVP
jgi:hypothetical protein